MSIFNACLYADVSREALQKFMYHELEISSNTVYGRFHYREYDGTQIAAEYASGLIIAQRLIFELRMLDSRFNSVAAVVLRSRILQLVWHTRELEYTYYKGTILHKHGRYSISNYHFK
jgi:hypothetical protein